MLAKLASALPETGDYLFEPKWDGFRAIVFRTAREVLIQSRDLRPFDRYFPDLHDAFLRLLPRGCVVDGEIVMAARSGLDFDALQLRLHPAASRVAALSEASSASYVVFDVLCRDRRTLMHQLETVTPYELQKVLAAAPGERRTFGAKRRTRLRR